MCKPAAETPGQSDAERAWNKAHGLTATCPVCTGAMKPGRDVCSWACWDRAHATARKLPSDEALHRAVEHLATLLVMR